MIRYDEKEARATDRAYLTPDIVRQRMATLEALQLRAGDRVLDVGCGTGLLAYDMGQLVGKAGEVLGIDLSEDMLRHAQGRCDGLPQVRFAQGNCTALAASDGYFDAVVCTQVLLYVADLETALAEFRRVMKPGGRLVVIETDWRGAVLNSSDDSLTRRILAAWDGAMASPNLPPTLSPRLSAAGFVALRVEAVPILNTSFNAGNFSHNMAKGFARYAERHDAVTKAESDAWLADLERLADEKAYFFCVNRFLFSGVKG
ncbi:MAG TPA: methyltransferase domain-containing protein [Kiloniellaceae bacterium]|nr:methyltransferase domain-containing protein [Kiloniellaceae bacterium]